uniref:Uncharacterized protein n=1 Tax=Scleropages formosus TaxID=113540 RepID=A0A8C9RN90_SCLFO
MLFSSGRLQKNPAGTAKGLKKRVFYSEKLEACECKKCEKVSLWSKSHNSSAPLWK